MAELIIKEFQNPGAITFNYEELKAEIAEKAKTYETLVYTDQTIAEAKTDKANLNRLKKALNDERLRREKEYMGPFNDFKAKINEIIGIIDKPVQIIDAQVKEFENAEKAKKKTEVESIWEECNHPNWMSLDQIWNERWLNKTYSIGNIRSDIKEELARIENEINTISTLKAFSFEAMETYKHSLDFARAIAEGQRLADIQKRKLEAEEKEKADAENKQPDVPIAQESREEMPETPKAEPKWIRFQALLTVPQALALKEFFNSHNIEFKPIN